MLLSLIVALGVINNNIQKPTTGNNYVFHGDTIVDDTHLKYKPSLDMADTISLLSFNTQGIKLIKKRQKVFAWLKKKNAQIYLLQETHSSASAERDWLSDWGDEIIFSHGTTNSRGVAVAFNGNYEHTVNETITDTEGRYIILDLVLNQVRTVLVNIYAPNEDDVTFFQEVMEKLAQIDCTHIVWGGVILT